MQARPPLFTLVASTLVFSALGAAARADQFSQLRREVAVADGIGIHQPAAAALAELASIRGGTDVPTRPMTLGTAHIPRLVKADDQPLRPGTYQVRLMGDPLKPAVGETPHLEQWVEFLQHGKVKGKAVASIVPPDQIQQVATERAPKPGGVRVDVLKGNDYVRVWFNKGGNLLPDAPSKMNWPS